MEVDKKKIEEKLIKAILHIDNEELNKFEFLDSELSERQRKLANDVEQFAFIHAERVELAIVNRRQKLHPDKKPKISDPDLEFWEHTH